MNRTSVNCVHKSWGKGTPERASRGPVEGAGFASQLMLSTPGGDGAALAAVSLQAHLALATKLRRTS